VASVSKKFLGLGLVLTLSGLALGPHAQLASLTGYIESAEQSRTAEQNKISKLTVKLQIISTEHDCRM